MKYTHASLLILSWLWFISNWKTQENTNKGRKKRSQDFMLNKSVIMAIWNGSSMKVEVVFKNVVLFCLMSECWKLSMLMRGAYFTSDIVIELRVAVLKLWGHSDTMWCEQTLRKRFVDVLSQEIMT